MTITKKFGFAVREKRESKGISQEQLAEMAGISRESIVLIEGGTRNKSIKNKTAESIAKALNCSLSVLLTDK